MKKYPKTGNYQLCLKYIKESKNYFYAILIIFALSALIGFLFPVFFVDAIKKLIEGLALKTQGMNFFELFVFIFSNNITTAFLSMLLGIVFIFPLLVGFFNGYVVGFVANKVAGSFGYSILFRLLPHGIFELPALIISLGLGLKIGFFIFAKNKKKYLKYNLTNSLRVFVYIILPLLIIAGIIGTGLMILIK